MMKNHLLLLKLLALIFFTTFSVQAQQKGSFSKTIYYYTQARTINYYVPITYNSTISYKLVVGLHGCGEATGSNLRDQIKFLSDSLNAIILCPEGLTMNDGYMASSDEVKFIINSIDSTKKNYNINSNEIYLTGFSCNGYTTANMGLKKKYPFKGIIPFNPALSTYDFTGSSFVYTNNVSTCLCAGTADPNYSLDLRLSDSLVAHNAPLLFNSIPGVGHTTSFSSFKQEIMKCFHYFSISTGIKNEFSFDNIVIYPNPTSGRIAISSIKKINKIEIYNLLGEKVYYSTTIKQNEIDLSKLTKGIHFIKIDLDDKTLTEKIVLQ